MTRFGIGNNRRPALRAEVRGGGILRLYDGTDGRFDVEAGLMTGKKMS
jgi:hypothetical protein